MLNHIALQYPSMRETEKFFSKILGLRKERGFTITAELGNSIFGIIKEVEVIVFGNDRIKFEIFISNEPKKFSYEHICLNVINKTEFIIRCKKYGIKPIIIKKGDKELLFVRDFANYLYEIKEK